MLEHFLKKYREELLSTKLDYEEQLDLLRTKIRENEKFIELLQTDESDVFTEFSPREIASKNSEKIKELRQQLSDDRATQENIRKKLSETDQKLAEVNKIIDTEFNPLRGERKAAEDTGVSKQTEANDVPENGDAAQDHSFDTVTVETEIPKQQASVPTDIELGQSNISPDVLSSIITKLEDIEKYVVADPMRSKISIQKVVSELRELVN